MTDGELYPRYRFVMGAITLICAALTYLALIITSPLLTHFSEAFSIDIATAGYITTLHVMAMGVFMFVGPVIIGAIDIKRTQLLGVGIMALGLLTAYLAPSFGWLLFARVITGIGHGISGSCTNSVIAAWFPTREKSVMITLNNLGLAAMTAFGYSAVIPAYRALGDSWRGVMLVMLILLVAVELSWIFLGRDNRAMNEKVRREGRSGSAFSGMREALSRRDSWCLTLYMGFATAAASGISTYLPQFLERVRGYTDAGAASMVGLTTGIGAAGTFLGGIAATALGKRKVIILPFLIAGSACCVIMLLMNTAWGIALFLFLYTLCTNFRSTASWTIATELDGVTPALASAVSAMIYGVGNLLTLAAPSIYAWALGAFGAERAILSYTPGFAVALIFALLLPETGPGRIKRGEN